MKVSKLLLTMAFLLLSTNIYAQIDYVTVTVNRPALSLVIGRYNEKDYLDKINKKLYDACIRAGAKKIDYISYTNIQTLLRDKDSANICATAWFEK